MKLALPSLALLLVLTSPVVNEAQAAAPAGAPTGAPAGATGQCKDGTFWTGKLRLGACHGHKGVQTWYGAPSSPAATPLRSAPMAAQKLAAPTGGALGGAGQVWVNTRSKVYHCPSDPFYGKTKQGQYMTEAAAIAAGDHADHGKACR